MRLGELPRATIFLGAAMVIEMATGMLANKILAVITGPEGVAVVAQVAGLQATALLLAGLGMPSGITMYVAEADRRGDAASLGRTLATGFLVPVVIALILTLGVIICAAPLSRWLLNGPPAADLIRIAALGVTFSMIYRLGDASFQGLRATGPSSVVRIVVAIASLGVAVMLTLAIGVRGAVLGVSIQAVIGAVTLLVFLSGTVHRREVNWRLFRPDSRLLLSMTRIGAAVMISLVFSSLGTLWLRSYVIQRLGIGAAGIFQAAWALIAQLYALSITVLAFYTYPKVSATQDDAARTAIINESLAFITLVITAGVLLLLTVREPVLTVMYRSDFESASRLLPLLGLGGLFATALWPIGTPMLPKRRLIQFVTLNAIVALLFPLAALILLPQLGLMGLCVAYFVANVCGFFLFLADARRSIGFILSKENRLLLLTSALSITLQALVVDRSHAAIALRFGLAVSWFAVAAYLARRHLARLGIIPLRQDDSCA